MINTDAPPTEEDLVLLIKNGLSDIARSMIEQWKLSYVIEDGQLKDALKGTALQLKRFITEDPDMIALKDSVHKLSKCDDEILITGETGTGKEIIAKAMIGDRQAKFIAVNCAGLPSELIESELFGHKRGSFTGSLATDKEGMFSVAGEGVMFLDEIGELPLGVQGKLLRAIQEKTIRKVGSNTEEKIYCKFVCATRCNLKKMVTEGTFRDDLFARISTFELHITPLRDRESDIKPIIASMPKGKEFNDAIARAGIPVHKLDTQFNVRSLQQHVKRWAVLGRMPLA